MIKLAVLTGLAITMMLLGCLLFGAVSSGETTDVWFERVKHLLVCIVGVVSLGMIGYFAALASGIPISIRFFL
jgi:hypothetical protein